MKLKGNLDLLPPASRRLWAAIRWCTDGYHYIDIGTLAPSYDDSRTLAEGTDAEIPSWAKENPVVNYHRVKVTLEEG